MRKRLRRLGTKSIFGLFVLFLVCGFVVESVYATRFWDRVVPVGLDNCHAIEGLVGAEDAIATQSGPIILSLDPRQEQAGNGRLVLMKDAHSEPIVLWNGNDSPFHPHGLDYKVEQGKELLYVVNHLPDHDAVMVFQLQDNRLTLLSQLNYEGHGLNDVLAVEQGHFYVTVDHLPNPAWLNRIGDYLRLPLGAIDYFDGQRFVRQATGIAFANGIAASPDGQRVYVASMLAGKVLVFDVDAQAGLHQRMEVSLPGKPDNLSWQGDNTLLVALHPRILDLAKQEKWRDHKAPSRIVKLTFQTQADVHIEEILADDGQGIASSSVAIFSNGALWVGSVFDNKVLVCDQPW